MLAICLDCNCSRELNQFYRCSTCDSSSVIRPGSTEAVNKLISHAKAGEEKRKRDNVIKFTKGYVSNTGFDVQKKGSSNA